MVMIKKPLPSPQMATIATALSTSVMGAHLGNLFMMAAGRYPRLHHVILEQVQNSIDSNAKHIWLVVNYRNRHVIYRDDGEGANQAEFEAAIKTVGRTQKKSDKMGRFGIGVISPLGKCKHFTFTSTKRESGKYLQWKFVTKDIESSEGKPEIPLSEANYVFGDGQGQVRWATEVWIYDFETDTTISQINPENLQAAILDRFGGRMRQLGIELHLAIIEQNGTRMERVIKARDYSGTRLPEFRIIKGSAGKITIDLYLLKKIKVGREKGRVVVGEAGGDGFRIPFSDFVSSSAAYLSGEVCDALQSGYFEGEILCQGVTLKPERNGFVENDALKAFCQGIDEWYQAQGSECLDQEREEQQAERLQTLGRAAMADIENLLRDPLYEYLVDVVKSARLGTTGVGHVKVPSIGTQPETSLSPSAPKPGGGHCGGTSEPGPKKPPEKEKDHIPGTVVGPHGDKRKIVRSNSLGLQFKHEPMEGDDDLWKFDTQTGLIRFNIRHPCWKICDKKNSSLIKLQSFVALQILSLYAQPDVNWHEQQRLVLDLLTKPMANMLLAWDSPKPKKKAEVT